ncbi:MAG: glycoside hydrolase family 25 protein [Mogibacterium sp.]|nr:glycoside hydrolase family 25 protein [Mogibacterium sp.]
MSRTSRDEDIERRRAKARQKALEAKDRQGTKRPSRQKKAPIVRLRLIVIGVLAICLIALVLRVISYVGGISKVHLNDEGLTHAKRYENFIKVHGIDVSEFQEGDINWKKVKSSEADFVFVRAGFRKGETGELVEDADFKKNMKGANRAGIMTGAYFFSQALNEEEAVEEAKYLIELVEPYDIDMPLVIDYELLDGGRLQEKVDAGEMPAASNYHDIVVAFCDTVETAGYEACVYANYDMLTNYMDSTILDDMEFIWAAQYGGSCDVKGNYMFWQCAEDAKIGGIEGNVDHDIWYIDPDKVYPTYAKGKKDAVSIEECDIKFDKDSYKLINHRAIPRVQVNYDGKKLRKGIHYEISFVRNETEGTGYAIIRGIDSYKDWMAVPFKIE